MTTREERQGQWKEIRSQFFALALGLLGLALLPVVSLVFAIPIGLIVGALSLALSYNLFPWAGYLCVALSLVLLALNVRSWWTKESNVCFIGGGLTAIGLMLGSFGEVAEAEAGWHGSLPFILDFEYAPFLIWIVEILTYGSIAGTFRLIRMISVALISLRAK